MCVLDTLVEQTEDETNDVVAALLAQARREGEDARSPAPHHRTGPGVLGTEGPGRFGPFGRWPHSEDGDRDGPGGGEEHPAGAGDGSSAQDHDQCQRRRLYRVFPGPRRPMGSGKPKSVQRELAGRSVCISWANPWVRREPEVGREAAGFGGDLGIDLIHGSVAVVEDVVLVVEFSETLGQGQLMSVALVNPEGELPRRELSGEHAACEARAAS